MFIFSKEAGGASVLHVGGKITLSDYGDLENKVVASLKLGIKRVVVSLSECNSLTSDFICALSKLQSELAEREVTLFLDDLSSTNRRIYSYMHMESKLPLYEFYKPAGAGQSGSGAMMVKVQVPLSEEAQS